jgi:uncharacterized membrane protein required for colicin V production
LKIDLVVLVALLLVGGMGMWSGAIRQLANLGGLVAGYLGARPLGAFLGPLVAQKFGYPLLFSSIACSFIAFFVVYALTVMLLRLVLSKLVPDGEHGALNRLGGFLLGTAKAGAIAFVALSALVFVEKPLIKLWSDYRGEAKSSIALGLARRHNLLARLPQVASLEKLVKASSDPEAAARLAEAPEFKALAKDPRVRSIADDAAVRRALESGDYAALLSSVKVLNLLNDPRMSEKLARAAADAAPAEAPPPAAEPVEAKEAKPRAKSPR